MTAQPPRVLRTPRVVLEATGPEHAAALWRGIESSRRELEAWLPWAVDPSLAGTRAFIERVAGAWRQGSGWNFTILLQQQPVGSLGVDRHEPLFASAHLGYWLRSDCCGRGLMTEAASAAVRFAFGHAGLHRLELRAAPDNPASARVAEKLGFTREGLLREASAGVHGFHDVWVYGLLASDPQPRWHLP
jgi:RimJ/RimL family protein N-acetyltransferase